MCQFHEELEPLWAIEGKTERKERGGSCKGNQRRGLKSPEKRTFFLSFSLLLPLPLFLQFVTGGKKKVGACFIQDHIAIALIERKIQHILREGERHLAESFAVGGGRGVSLLPPPFHSFFLSKKLPFLFLQYYCRAAAASPSLSSNCKESFLHCKGEKKIGGGM